MFRRKKDAAPQTADYLIVGLGNPGRRYETTRHNAGFLALDLLARSHDVKLNKSKCHSLYAVCQIGGKSCVLIKPQTYMNLSGAAVRDMAQAFSVAVERIIVVFDDAALPAGKLRVRRSGSDGGHNGIKDILYQLASDKFPRVKIGIGAPDRAQADMKDFVLDEMDADAYDGVKLAPGAVTAIVESGVDAAMQRYN